MNEQDLHVEPANKAELSHEQIESSQKNRDEEISKAMAAIAYWSSYDAGDLSYGGEYDERPTFDDRDRGIREAEEILRSYHALPQDNNTHIHR